FIEKERALVGQFESSDSLRQGSRKRPLLMSEQLAFEQARGNRGAVHFDEAAFFPTAQLMDCSGDEFLSRSGFPLDEDSRIGGRYDLKALYDRLKCRPFPDHVPDIMVEADFVFQVELLGSEPLLHLPQLTVAQ